jgi:ParB family transcriptional regulator, chromosome partitioning protein
MKQSAIAERANVVVLQERRVDRTVLRTYRHAGYRRRGAERQPAAHGAEGRRRTPTADRSERGALRALLVKPHPDLLGKFRIIDGDRRWTNSRILVERGSERSRQIPVEVTDRTLSEDERLRVWIYIHRQRKEWDAKEKEMVAYRLR